MRARGIQPEHGITALPKASPKLHLSLAETAAGAAADSAAGAAVLAAAVPAVGAAGAAVPASAAAAARHLNTSAAAYPWRRDCSAGRVASRQPGPGRGGGSIDGNAARGEASSTSKHRFWCVLWASSSACEFPLLQPGQLATHVCLPGGLVKPRAILLAYPSLTASSEQQRAAAGGPSAVKCQQGCKAGCLVSAGRAAAHSASLSCIDVHGVALT